MKNNKSHIVVRNAIKELLKKYNLTYKEFGQMIDLSESSVKQLMTRGKFTLEITELIASKFGFHVVEFMKMAYNKQPGSSVLSPEQEDILVSYPLSIYVMFQIGMGLSIQKIKERLKVSESKFQKSLLVLDRAGIVEVQNQNKVLIKVRGPYRFNKNGQLERQFRAGYFNVLLQQLSLKQPVDTFQRTFELYFSDKLFDEMKTEMGTLIDKYAQLSRIEAEVDPNGRTFPVTGLFFLKEFDGWGTYIKSIT